MIVLFLQQLLVASLSRTKQWKLMLVAISIMVNRDVWNLSFPY